MPVAQWTERCPATAAAAGIPAGRVTRGRSSVRESTGLPPRRGPFEPGRPLQASEARGVTGSMASSNLAGPGSNPGGPVHERPSRAGAARPTGGARRPYVRAHLQPNVLSISTRKEARCISIWCGSLPGRSRCRARRSCGSRIVARRVSSPLVATGRLLGGRLPEASLAMPTSGRASSARAPV